MNSASVFAGTEGCTTMTRSDELTGATGARSFISVYGFFASSVSLVVWVLLIISSV